MKSYVISLDLNDDLTRKEINLLQRIVEKWVKDLDLILFKCTIHPRRITVQQEV